MRATFAAVFLCAAIFAFAESRIGALLWPLPDSKVLTGGFADSRTDHFHGGVDLRARTPLPVVAPTNGWIERIAVQPSGYGRVLYYRMEDGHTAVFGHLSRFVTPVEEALRDSELVAGTYRVDFSYREPQTELRFARGETIAYTGKSGVGPPHLHFEVREGAVQTDPLANYAPVDKDKPVIVALWWTTLSQYSPLSSGNPLEEAKDKPGTWLTHMHEPIHENEPVAFFIQTYDPGPWGRHAVPSIVRIKDGKDVLYETHPARIDLLAKDFYSAIVWPEQKRNKKDIRRLFAPPPPRQFHRSPERNESWISGLRDETLTIEVEDRAGNITKALVPVTCGDFDSTRSPAPPTLLNAGPFQLQTDDVMLAWARMDSVAPREVIIAPFDLGFARACTLSYRFQAGERLPGLFFYERTASGGMRAIWRMSGLDHDGAMSCTIFHGGTFGVGVDDAPPTAQFSVRQGKIRFKVRDALSYIDDSSIRCRVDSATAIAEYEYEGSGGLIWTQEPLRRGPHRVEFTAADRAGNVGHWLSEVRIP